MLPGLLSRAVAGALRERIEAQIGAARESRIWTALDRPSRQDDVLRGFVRSPALGRLASGLIAGGRPEVDPGVRYWSDAAYIKMPAARQGASTPWHQDQPYRPYDRQGSLVVWIALNEVPPARGSLRFFSGSHRLGSMGRHLNGDGFDTLDEYPWIADECELSPALHLQPGDATVHSGVVVHSAPENATDEPRWVYTVTYMPAEALYNGMPHAEIDKLGLEINRPFDHPEFPIVHRGTTPGRPV